MLIYPKLNPPEFMVEELSDQILILHYYSSREGLTHFVVGLLKGLAKMYDAQIQITLVSSEKDINWHDLFEIKIS
jgi:hypothetical protein